jgi:hypothetical protein
MCCAEEKAQKKASLAVKDTLASGPWPEVSAKETENQTLLRASSPPMAPTVVVDSSHQAH